MVAYYNEICPKKAAVLRELIRGNHIAPGVVDERSIVDVRPSDLHGFDQCHFFAGAGIWSYAARLAGWHDNRRVWTASCPCQPFSAAGQGAGFDDERHLWPYLHYLIQHAKPAGVPVYCEQVAGEDGLAWFDLVASDMEAINHTARAFDLCAAGFGAPHIRQRLYVVITDDGTERLAVDVGTGLEGYAGHGADGDESGRLGARALGPAAAQGIAGWLANGDGQPGEWHAGSLFGTQAARDSQRRCHGGSAYGHQHGGADGRMADADGGDASEERQQCGKQHGQQQDHHGSIRLADAAGGQFPQPVGGAEGGNGAATALPGAGRPGPVNGFWRAADWIRCRDERWRPIKPGTFPLVNGTAARVVRLRMYGDGIVAQQAAEFIKATEGVVVWPNRR